MPANRIPPYDTAELTVIRTAIRTVYHSLRHRFRSDEAKAWIDQLDAMCVELTGEIEAFEPELPILTDIVATSWPQPMRVTGGVA